MKRWKLKTKVNRFCMRVCQNYKITLYNVGYYVPLFTKGVSVF